MSASDGVCSNIPASPGQGHCGGGSRTINRTEREVTVSVLPRHANMTDLFDNFRQRHHLSTVRGIVITGGGERLRGGRR